MKEQKTDKRKVVIIAVVIIAAILAMLLIYNNSKPSASEGSKNVTIEVVDNTETSTEYEVSTDAEYLSEVFEEAESEGLSIEGEESEYGLFITTVNGVTADYDADGAYWSIWVNGEMGQYGADSQVVNDGDEFSLIYTVD